MKKVLIKCGGSIIDDLSEEFFSSLHDLKKSGYQIVIVHGGGPDINRMLEILKVEACFVDGLRKTDLETLKVVELVLTGQTNRKLVDMLTKNGLKAIGISGSDNGILEADIVDIEKLGYVGEIYKVNKSIIERLLNEDLIPVLTPIGVNSDGMKLNVNADYAAASIANALEADHCLFVTDVMGIRIDGQMVSQIYHHEILDHINSGQIYGGMIPKVHSAISAIEKGFDEVMIVSGKQSFYQNEQFLGTKIVNEKRLVQ